MIYYLLGLFGFIFSIVIIFYFKASENVRIKILDILQVYGAILGLISVFLVTYDGFISKNIDFIKSVTEFNRELSRELGNILNDFKNKNFIDLKREIFNNKQQNELKKTVLTDEEYIIIYKMFIVLNSLFKKYKQENKLLKKQVEYKIFFSFIKKCLNSNKVIKFWDLHHQSYSRSFNVFISKIQKDGIDNIEEHI